MKRVLLCLAFCILIFMAAGCGKKQPYPDDIRSFAGSGSISDLNNQLFAAVDLSAERGEYLLGPGDLLEIKVFEVDRLNSTVRVSSRGLVTLPLLGELEIGGLTASEAERLVEEKYRQTYLKNPHVNIFVKEYYSQRITVVGQVKEPGSYDYPSRLRLLDAIALAGGLTDKAGHTVQIKRFSTAGQEAHQTFVANLDHLINEGRTELNVSINGGDIIFVPEAGSFYVDGAVRRPGQYHIRRIITPKEALLVAGGLSPYANDKRIFLLREDGEGTRQEIRVDIEASNIKDEMKIMDGDIIFVNASFWGKLFSGGGINIGIPGLGVSYRDPER